MSTASAATTTAVLLVNTGTPAAPRAREVRQFLRPFLSDPRVVELPRLLWLPLLNGVILPLRAPRSARNYQRVWRNDGSPLAVYSTQLRNVLDNALQQRAPAAFAVKLAYLYSSPGVAAAIDAFCASGIRRLVVLPMYPQYSGTTTAAVFDQVTAALQCRRDIPELHFVSHYFDEPPFIAALAASVREHWRADTRSEHLLMSFHGIPERCVQRGDPYATQCRSTAELLAAALALSPDDWSLSFQSRFGKARWLEPATDQTLARLARDGKRSLDVICPGFAVDCLETLEEIAIAGREIFQHAGGGDLRYIGALNGRADHAAALASVVQRAAGAAAGA
jgi:protoporphyrin/coproporphyrin ferrochelatase